MHYCVKLLFVLVKLIKCYNIKFMTNYKLLYKSILRPGAPWPAANRVQMCSLAHLYLFLRHCCHGLLTVGCVEQRSAYRGGTVTCPTCSSAMQVSEGRCRWVGLKNHPLPRCIKVLHRLLHDTQRDLTLLLVLSTALPSLPLSFLSQP